MISQNERQSGKVRAGQTTECGANRVLPSQLECGAAINKITTKIARKHIDNVLSHLGNNNFQVCTRRLQVEVSLGSRALANGEETPKNCGGCVFRILNGETDESIISALKEKSTGDKIAHDVCEYLYSKMGPHSRQRTAICALIIVSIELAGKSKE